MNDTAYIKSRDSLEHWLTDWPRENGKSDKESQAIAVSIAHRFAMRVLPLWWNWSLGKTARKRELTVLPVLRCSLISGVASLTSVPEIIKDAAAVNFGVANAANSALAAANAAANAYAASAAYAAAAAATAAANAVAVAAADSATYASNAAAKAAVSAANAGNATAVAWMEIRTDCERIAAGQNLQDVMSAPLWSNIKNPFESKWQAVKSGATAPEWAFWIKWYDDVLGGFPQNWKMLEQIALIDPKVWEAGAEAVAEEIERLQQESKTSESTKIFEATLYDFKFDALRHVMLAVPMPQDWETLTDPKQLAKFLKDALDLREDMAILSQAFAAEGGAAQGSGMTMIYMAQVLDELQNAETVGALRVGKLVEWGRILESVALREDTKLEFGPVAEPFGMAVEKLKELIRNHFAHTLARFSVLRDIRMEEDAAHWEVLKDLRSIVDSVRSGANGTLPALDEVDVVVLDDILDSIDRMIRELDQTESKDSRSSLRRDIDFQMAKVGATAGVYGDKARNALQKGGEASDEAIKWGKRGQGLWSMLRAVHEWIEGSGGG